MHEFDLDLFSDCYKDATGHRPSVSLCEWFDALPYDEKESYYNRLVRQIEEDILEEKKQEQIAIANFEKTIANMIANGANDRKTAIRWFVDSLGLEPEEIKFYGADYACYEAGLPFSLTSVIAEGI